MVGEIEAAGDFVTGGLIARAIEPRSGEAAEHGEAVCLNCGTALAGAYCHRCGQPEHIHRSLAALWHDIAHSVLHFEGKAWRTLPLLAWRPGELTRRYIAGERARFVSPMALFLFSVFLMFAVFSTIGGSPGSGTPAEDRAEALREFREEQAGSLADLRRLEGELVEARAAGAPVAGLEAELRGIRTELAAGERTYELAARLAGDEDAGGSTPSEGDRFRIGVETGWKTLDEAMAKAEQNPSLFFYKLKTNAYKFSWALIPISVPFLWLIFAWRREYRVYDHAVFVTYSLSFMTLMVVTLTAAGAIGLPSDLIELLWVIVPPLHMYRQLRGAYGLGRGKAILRTLALLVFASIALLLFTLLLVALGLLG